jgi:hypothetical protein
MTATLAASIAVAEGDSSVTAGCTKKKARGYPRPSLMKANRCSKDGLRCLGPIFADRTPSAACRPLSLPLLPDHPFLNTTNDTFEPYPFQDDACQHNMRALYSSHRNIS